eukprot:c25755_g1_i1.p1 GENE.c25755_g1_i1~~c25755_g1_i1.p1  ORF type:complete len:706 (-),score=190.83 c25755_g1_i1:153-2270(-)
MIPANKGFICCIALAVALFACVCVVEVSASEAVDMSLIAENAHMFKSRRPKLFPADPNCKLWVRRTENQDVKRKVISVAMFKASVKYLDNFERAIVKWPVIVKKIYGDDWAIRFYVDATAFKLVESMTADSLYSVKISDPVTWNMEHYLTATLGLSELTMAALLERGIETWTDFMPARTREAGHVDWFDQPWAAALDADDRDKIQKFRVRKLQLRDTNSFAETLMRMLELYDNVEVWEFECPHVLPYVGRPNQGHGAPKLHVVDDMPHEGHRFFSTMMRFHPMFDTDVDVMVSHNLEFLSGPHEAQLVNDWLAGAFKPYFAYVRDKKYHGEYPECNVRNTFFPSASKPNVIEHYSGFAQNFKQHRNMLMAGLFAAQRHHDSHTILPSIAWQAMVEMTKVCGFPYTQYGIDEIALNYALKYFPEAFKAYALQNQGPTSTQLTFQFTGEVFPRSMVPTDFESRDLGAIPILSPRTLRAQPLFKDLASLFRSRLAIGPIGGIIDPAPLKVYAFENKEKMFAKCDFTCDMIKTPYFVEELFSHCAHLIAEEHKIGYEPSKAWYADDDTSVELDQFLQAISDFHFCTSLEVDIANMIHQQLRQVIALDPHNNELPAYKKCVRQILAEYLTDDPHTPDEMDVAWVEGKFDACMETLHEDARFETRNTAVWFLAILEEGITTSMDFEGFALKSKTGEMFTHSILRVYGLTNW